MKKLIMAFSGPSNSGKTTLITAIANELIKKKLKVVLIKHDPSDKAQFDHKGKDSFLFFETGAETIVLSPTRTTFFSHKERDVLKALKLAGDFDICLVEGLKELKLPRICVFYNEIDKSYFAFSQAVASHKKIVDKNLTWLDLNDIHNLCEYVLQNAKNIQGEI
ncbi:molybdopterin-guanine dinucleotide biosynthesis protein B [Campylobacter sp. MIT 21-1685]|uniref:molybdopterin-guanine dinucleotide biosynthesis protein B n=1 Tax=unclassified Campylobacter TaxID=2593542 RepID=UPI00224B6E56|nr:MULTISPECIES: molybdopterin-guanine dinucleotide biosynthesis protein B [unclassified Campylobacter]MCX2682759.1 molybdopterin-guanine dinucleotide biosynthesis protein B [Campylobacter sp. MIT 21-1684]MCX2751095.1 molybdopterin-guanine dinucleotide biosynthesis protein B [Campylobacter sp. MIT 21-1682]MCX2807240.1 molybdopterin-guanine dinucleotide biosynthesis protein B [Campylobacter sp. MIT 21-1685]